MRTDTFKLDLDQIEFGDGLTLTALMTADVLSDDEGTFFQLYALRCEGKRVEKTDWRWAAVSEWIAFDAARNKLGIVRCAHAEAPEFQKVAA
jgi:hypothetical protein